MGRPDVIGRRPSPRGLEFRYDLRKTIRADPLFRSIGLEPVQNLDRSRSEPCAAGERSEVSDPFVVCRPVGSVPLFALDRLGRCRRMWPLLRASKETVLAIIPAYCEGRFVGQVVRQVLLHVQAVLVVDDGSPDDTAHEAEV